MVRSLVTISTFFVGALARRNEETTGFVQIKEMKADLSQISYLQDVKSNLKKLALNRANVPAEAMDAIDAITEKLQDILPPLATEKANDVENANQVIGQFTTAGSIYSGAIAANNDVSNGTQSNAVSKK